jgi:hypothetical protein
MSIYGLKPQFTTYAGYQEWRKQWADVYKQVSSRIKAQKKTVQRYEKLTNEHEREWEAVRGTPNAKYKPNPHFVAYTRAREKLKGMSVAAHKLCTVLDEAKIRMGNITNMRKAMKEHLASFPISIEHCDRVDFHFNKKHLEFPWIPMWVLKTKGKTFYVHHVNALCPWSTRETPDHDSTKGSIRLRDCSLEIDADGVATLKAVESVAV